MEGQNQLIALIERLKAEDRFRTLDEAGTKQTAIMPVLNFLGWEVFNPDEVFPEFQVGTRKVDYACLDRGAPRLFLEAKRFSESLEDHQNQLLEYAFSRGVKLAILTNGLTWWFYLPLLEGSWEERRFFSIEILHQETEDIVARFGRYLGKQNVLSGRAAATAEDEYHSRRRRHQVKDALPQALENIIEDKESLLWDLLGEEVEKLTGIRADQSTMRKFLDKTLSVPTVERRPSVSARSKPPTQSELPRDAGSTISQQKSTRRRGRKPKQLPWMQAVTGTKPKRIELFGEWFEVTSWAKALRYVVETIYEKNPNGFRKLTAIKGRKRHYLVTDPTNMKKPVPVASSGFYLETNLSANDCMKFIGLFLEESGYSSDQFEIEFDRA